MTDQPTSKTSASIRIGEQGHFWVNIHHKANAIGTAVTGQMFVQYQIPEKQLHPFPIVLVHGGGGQGTDFLGTPDGRPGWASSFLQQGYAVYVVDRPGHGRSPMNIDVLGAMSPSPSFEMISMLTAPDPATAFWPTADLASRWPGTGKPGDPILDQFLASQGPSLLDMTLTEELMQQAGVALLEKIGPAILLTHSAGGPFGWLVADQRPDLVKGIIAVEPIGPPFAELPGNLGCLTWGFTATPFTYEPSCDTPEALMESPHSVPALKNIPIAVITSEASAWSLFDPATVEMLLGLGASVEHVKLADLGIKGNGHMMMLETNNEEIATIIGNWLEENLHKAS